MAKFCTNCGKELKENKVCDCKKETVKEIDLKNYLSTFMDVVKGMFTSPIETMKSFYKQSNLILTNIMIVAGSIIFGIFIMLLLKETVGDVFSLLTSGDLGSLFKQEAISFPYFRIFISATFISVLTYYLFTLVIQLFIKLVFKKKVEYKHMLNLIATISVYLTIVSLISIILVFVSLYLVWALLLISCILVIICLTFALKEIIGLDDMKVIYTIIASLMIMIFVNWLIMPRIFM